MTLQEQTDAAAKSHAEKWMNLLSNGIRQDCIDDFTAGAEWERQRDKWTYVYGKRENIPPPGQYWVMIGKYAKKPMLFELPMRGYTLGLSCEWWLKYVLCYQPIPEPPKQKED